MKNEKLNKENTAKSNILIHVLCGLVGGASGIILLIMLFGNQEPETTYFPEVYRDIRDTDQAVCSADGDYTPEERYTEVTEPVKFETRVSEPVPEASGHVEQSDSGARGWAYGAEVENPKAPQHVKAFIDAILFNDKVIITDICRQGSPTGHGTCEAVDVSDGNFDDPKGAFDWINAEAKKNGGYCVTHINFSGIEVSPGTANSHFHCELSERYQIVVEPVEPAEVTVVEPRRITKVLDAIAECENSKASANRYGIMTWKRGYRELATLTEEEARQEVINIFWRYIKANGDITWSRAMSIYAPAFENDHYTYKGCLENTSGISMDTILKDLLLN